MSELDKNISTGSTQLSRDDVPIPSSIFHVNLDPTDPNYNQYCKTLKACADAGKSGLDVGKQMVESANHLGNRLLILQRDADMVDGFQDTERFRMLDENHAVGWQPQAEKINPSHQLTTPQTPSDKAIVMVSRGITSIRQSSGGIDIVGVSRKKPNSLPSSSDHDAELETNSFLKKAA